MLHDKLIEKSYGMIVDKLVSFLRINPSKDDKFFRHVRKIHKYLMMLESEKSASL